MRLTSEIAFTKFALMNELEKTRFTIGKWHEVFGCPVGIVRSGVDKGTPYAEIFLILARTPNEWVVSKRLTFENLAERVKDNSEYLNWAQRELEDLWSSYLENLRNKEDELQPEIDRLSLLGHFQLKPTTFVQVLFAVIEYKLWRQLMDIRTLTLDDEFAGEIAKLVTHRGTIDDMPLIPQPR